ncbi:MAG: DNA-directed RNA polymerase subunit beta' [Candidatus Yanofskybacteria bacterium RIFCSPHIGHO2_02_FULL_41_11]|uniref:DNA-directed RNA polymerase subunit beta' n=1 Tax=Candidatus Yanofskybacteria bacterium RIFCSPHIGHO2_02_FULL_41_11 TaxID=1802675 RepID=A0A1F8FBH3_9BACT|nr:MAG: DNA-directed RNA polymerase subunit beta' [Candidatus Yanofskybacteria bacterium RIFCSPHIGHO2_02_FULL_41_11]
MDLSSIKLKIASPEDILSWSYGEVTKPETINYRTQKPERDGLFSEAIFGPMKDWECYCGKYKRIRYKGIVCDRCGVEITRSIVRRERMGHIKLATPVAHIWFLRGVPSKIATILGVGLQELERVIYFASYIVMKVNEDLKTEAMKRVESEFKSKIKNSKSAAEEESLKELKDREKNNLRNILRHRIISELDFRDLSSKYGEVFEAGIGAEAIKRLLEEIDFNDLIVDIESEVRGETNPLEQRKLARRLRFIKGMHKVGMRPEWMVLTILPVIPPALRPMVPLDGGRYATSDLNDLYRRVINRNNRLKHLLELKAPEVITKNEKRMLQESVDSLIDNSMRRGQVTTAASTGQKRALRSLADMLKGKQGRFRQNLLGKRVDYSGRSVIVIGPELKTTECGLPKRMALELFKPFVIGILIRKELAHNIKSASRLIEQETSDVWAALEEAMTGKLVLLNRAPTLHRLSVQAFKPILIEGKAIKIPALPTHAFNADFDGDQMAVHLPLTDEAQKEAKELMLSSHGILKPATGEPVASPSHDMSFGIYYMTSVLENARGEGKMFSSRYEALLAFENDFVNLRAKIKISNPGYKEGSDEAKIIETTSGRIMFNTILPKGFRYVNKVLTKPDLKSIGSDIWDEYGEEATVEFLDKVKDLGFHYATVSGVSWGMDDLKIPPGKMKIIEEADRIIEENARLYEEGLLTEYEKKSKAIEVWNNAKSELSLLVKKQLGNQDPAFLLVDSKSRGTWSVIDQLMGMRGIVVNPSGELIELPIRNSLKEGMTSLEYFISTHGARKGLVDTALKTATAGYLTRKLVDVAQSVVVLEEDCRDKEGYTMYGEDSKINGESLGKRIKGRITAEDLADENGNIIMKKGKMIDKEIAKKIDESEIDKIRIRSLVTCKALDGVCRLCYGHDLSRGELVKIGEAVGIITAQAIGEPGTQLTMRTFHTGGVAGGADITMGLPRVEEIFEARPPQFKALIADTDGKVISVEEGGKQKVVTIETGDGEKREHIIAPNLTVVVAKDDLVLTGQQLSEGHIDLKELFLSTNNIDLVARYIIREVQAIYFPTGDSINDKHVELIVRQMFSRVKIIDSGDTDLLAGDVVEKRRLWQENERVKQDKKREATSEQLLLGITKVSLTTDSFLSAASFQETARVLIDSATIGKEDHLQGLKENVIIGRLIPAGTGLGAELE